MPISIRPMELEELNTFMDLIHKEEGWNLGLHDLVPYYNADPKGFIGLLDEHNKLIGCISTVVHQDNLGFIGLFFIKKEARNKGYGAFLFEQALQQLKERLKKNPVIGLYAVPQQVARYKNSGFKTEFENHQYRWQINKPASNNHKSTRFTSENSAFFSKVADYDKTIFSASRAVLLATLLKMPGTHLFMLIKENNITGFGIIRLCREGYRIGPLYADNFENAKTLAEDLSSEIADTGKSIILDMPSSNKFTHIFAEYFGLTEIPANQTQAMFTDKPKDTLENIDKNYSALSLELG